MRHIAKLLYASVNCGLASMAFMYIWMAASTCPSCCRALAMLDVASAIPGFAASAYFISATQSRYSPSW